MLRLLLLFAVVLGTCTTVLPADTTPTFTISLETVLKHDDGKFLWFHPRATAVPGGVLLTLGGVSQPSTLVWLFDTKNLPDVGGWSFTHTNLHGAGANFLFLDGHAARWSSAVYWDHAISKGRTNLAELRWFPCPILAGTARSARANRFPVGFLSPAASRE